MKRFLMGLLCVLLSGTALASSLDAVRERVQSSMLLTGKIVVAPDGSVRSYAIDQAEKLPPAVIGLIDRNVSKWKFEPTLLDGNPVAAQAKMSLRIVATPAGKESYSVSISGASFGQGTPGESISAKQQRAPRYPELAVHAHVPGTVYLVIRVGRQGQVEDVVAEQVNLGAIGSDRQMKEFRQLLADAAVRAARHWTFNLPTKGKYVDAPYYLARVPINFNLTRLSQSREYGQWQSYVPGPRQPVPWFDHDQVISASADAFPAGGIYQVDQGPHLTTPLNGA